MSTYMEVNEAVFQARRKHSNRGISLIILMGRVTYCDYMQSAPPRELVGPQLTIQGYRVIEANMGGYMICRGA